MAAGRAARHGTSTGMPSSSTVLSISFLAFAAVALLSNFLISSHLVIHIAKTDSSALVTSLQRFRTVESGPQTRIQHVDQNEEEEEEAIRMQLNGLLGPTKEEAPIHNPIPASGQDSFSACLLLMDDNHRAVEWMAYHYHVLPLRYLIVAVDPRSHTSPTPILNRYRKMGVYIEEWTDHDFLDPRLANNVVPDDARFQIKRDRHRARQKVFYRACLLKMQAANRTYVTLHDTDEYLVYNNHHNTGSTKGKGNKRRGRRKNDNDKEEAKNIMEKSKQPSPTTGEAGAMIDYILQERANGNPNLEGPCISVPRLHFGAIESTPVERTNNLPDGFESEQLETFRWRKHSTRDDFVKNNLAKVILDVSRADIDSAPRFRSLHRPIPTICTAPWIHDSDAGLRINHYLGSWEAFSFRDDSRRGGERSREVWEFQAGDADETDDTIRPWLEGFVQTHGHDKARTLLLGAGLPRTYKNTNDTAWRSMWLESILESNQTKGTNPKNHEFDAFVRRKFMSS